MTVKQILVMGADVNRLINFSMFLESNGFWCKRSSNPEIAIEQLQTTPFDLLLLESDEWFHDQAVFVHIQREGLLRWAPVLVVCEAVREVAKDYFNRGATDVMTRPVNKEDLMMRVRHLLDRANSIEQVAFRDVLTGVYNRRYFEQHVEVQLQRSTRSGESLSICFIDADRFKSVNDTYGHHVGDLVLQRLASLIQRHLSQRDTLARFGGEEFLILLAGSDEAAAFQTMNRILETARQEPVAVHDGGQKRYITFSGGICQWSPNMATAEWIKPDNPKPLLQFNIVQPPLRIRKRFL